MKKITITIIVLLAFCMGCKEKHCPAFPANLNYFPYYKGQELEFTNLQNDICIFVISDKDNSKEYSTSRTNKATCSAESYANLSKDSLTLACKIRIGGGVPSVFIDCFIKNNKLEELLFKQVNIPRTCPYNKISEHLSDTIFIENENNKLIQKIVIVKDKGLVSYTTVDGEKWVFREF